jgi:hypothetical protein
MPLAVPVCRLAEAQDRWRQAEENGAKYKVPGSEVEIDVWKMKEARPSILLGTNDPVRHAFDFLFNAISSSQYATDKYITLEFPYHSLGGDADLLRLGYPTEGLKLQWGLVKEIRRDVELEEIEIEQLGTTKKEALRASAFHPNRSHNFLIVTNPNTTYGYCLPARKLSSDYWSGEQFIYMPGSEVEEFRFATTEPDWFADLHRRIISPNAQSERPEHIFPDNAVPEDYAITEDDDHGIEDPLSEHELSSYPWWKIKRWNNRAAQNGWGVYIPLGFQCKIANVVWVGYRWSEADQAQYVLTRQLPVSFHQGDIPRSHPTLLIRVLSAHETNADCTTTVSGWHLENERFPCLYYVDCGTYSTKHIRGPGLLFPSEFINRDLLKDQYTDLVGKRIISGPGGARKIGDASREREAASYVANLQHCLLAPCSGFHVHEGKDFDDAINQFVNAHVNDYKPVTWYEDGNTGLTATLEYVFLAHELWQALADDWIPGGVIRIPVSHAKKPKDDIVDNSDGISATHCIER